MKIDSEFEKLIVPLSDEEFRMLEQSLLKEGCREALCAWNNILVDGHHRYKICKKYGIPFRARKIKFRNRDEAKIWIIENQLARRNLNNYQRSVLALKRKDIISVMAKEHQATSGKGIYGGKPLPQNSAKAVEARKELAKFADVSHDTITKVAKIMDKAPKEIIKKLEADDMSVNQAFIQTMAIENRGKLKERKLPSLPKGKFRCIVIDPPYDVKKIERAERPNQYKEMDYPIMSVDEIKELPIPDLAEQKGCHVYLWTTHKYLPSALRIFEAWGVKYQCLMTWVKKTGMTPFSWMYNTEHVLFGRIGSLDLKRKGIKLSFFGRSERHSQKPEEFDEIVRQASPEPRLEMFARKKKKGFVVWGNEV